MNDVLDGREFPGEVEVGALVRDRPGTNGSHLAFSVTLHIRPFLDDLDDLALAFPDLVDAGRDRCPLALLHLCRYASVELAYGKHRKAPTTFSGVLSVWQRLESKINSVKGKKGQRNCGTWR